MRPSLLSLCLPSRHILVRPSFYRCELREPGSFNHSANQSSDRAFLGQTMPVLSRRQASDFGNTFTPGRIAGITIIAVAIMLATGICFYRRRQWRRKAEKGQQQSSRRFIKVTFPRPAPDPELPPYESPRASRETRRSSQVLTSGRRRSIASIPSAIFPRNPPPARVATPPEYERHVADRPAGPISDMPPAYRETEGWSWGRSGCSR